MAETSDAIFTVANTKRVRTAARQNSVHTCSIQRTRMLNTPLFKSATIRFQHKTLSRGRDTDATKNRTAETSGRGPATGRRTAITITITMSQRLWQAVEYKNRYV